MTENRYGAAVIVGIPNGYLVPLDVPETRRCRVVRIAVIRLWQIFYLPQPHLR